MSRNDHRTRWIGRTDVQGRWCHAPGCHEFARTVAAQQVHADLFEARPFDTRHLLAPLDAKTEPLPMSEGERLLRDIFTKGGR